MGHKAASITVSAILSNHNSDQDAFDESAFEEFCHRVKMIAAETRYEEISLEVSVSGLPE